MSRELKRFEKSLEKSIFQRDLKEDEQDIRRIKITSGLKVINRAKKIESEEKQIEYIKDNYLLSIENLDKWLSDHRYEQLVNHTWAKHGPMWASGFKEWMDENKKFKVNINSLGETLGNGKGKLKQYINALNDACEAYFLNVGSIIVVHYPKVKYPEKKKILQVIWGTIIQLYQCLQIFFGWNVPQSQPKLDHRSLLLSKLGAFRCKPQLPRSLETFDKLLPSSFTRKRSSLAKTDFKPGSFPRKDKELKGTPADGPSTDRGYLSYNP